jgi:hypothetical protein
MKVGDLVRFIGNDLWIGTITYREITRVGTIYRIKWTDGASGVCWKEELELVE